MLQVRHFARQPEQQRPWIRRAPQTYCAILDAASSRLVNLQIVRLLREHSERSRRVRRCPDLTTRHARLDTLACVRHEGKGREEFITEWAAVLVFWVGERLRRCHRVLDRDGLLLARVEGADMHEGPGDRGGDADALRFHAAMIAASGERRKDSAHRKENVKTASKDT